MEGLWQLSLTPLFRTQELRETLDSSWEVERWQSVQMYVLSLLYLHFLTKKMKELDLVFSEVPYTALSLSFPTHTHAHPLGAHSHLPTPYTHTHTHTRTHTWCSFTSPHIGSHWSSRPECVLLSLSSLYEKAFLTPAPLSSLILLTLSIQLGAL